MMNSKYSNKWPIIRNRILNRDNRRCCFCSAKYNLDVHHIRPISLGGVNEDWNLITLCEECHVEAHRTIKYEVNEYGGLVTVPDTRWEEHRNKIVDKTALFNFAFANTLIDPSIKEYYNEIFGTNIR